MASEQSGPSSSAPGGYPNEVVIPYDYILNQSIAKENFDESGLYMMSMAVEKFTRDLTLAATNNGQKELVYDDIAEVIDNTKFEILKAFFPKRIKFGEVLAEQRRAASVLANQRGRPTPEQQAAEKARQAFLAQRLLVCGAPTSIMTLIALQAPKILMDLNL